MFSGKLFQKAIENFFPVFAWADMNTLGAGRNLDSHKPSTLSRVCINASNSSNPSSVYIRLSKQEKRFLLLKYCFLRTIFQLAIPAFLSRNIVLNIVHIFTCNVLYINISSFNGQETVILSFTSSLFVTTVYKETYRICANMRNWQLNS